MVSSLIIIGLIWGGYRLFMAGGYFLLKQGELGELFLDRLVYLGWSIIFYLLILSNLITGFSTLYRSPEVAFLMTLPLQNLRIFQVKFFENLIYSSWALLILGIPLTLAYGKLQGLLGWQYGLVFFTGMLPFLFLATVSASLLLMLLVMLSRYFKMRTLFVLLGLIFAGLFYLYFSVSQQNTILGGGLGNFRALGRYLTNLSHPPFPLIPSYWFTRLFLGSAVLPLGERFFLVALFISTATVGWELVKLVAERFYYQTYQLMEGQGQRRKHTAISRLFTADWPGIQLADQALVAKDMVQFLRTPQQWVQFLLMGFFIAVYLINLARGRINFEELPAFWRTTLYVFNFGFTGFILAALTVRFVYPMISMEGRSLWMLQMAPFSMKRLFFEKFWFAFFFLFTLTEVVALSSNFFLGQTLEVSIITSIFLFMTSLALISLSLGLGAVYAQFNESNPMKISSGYGGIITVVLSLIYVAVSVASLVLVINLNQSGGSHLVISGIAGLVMLLTLAYTWLPLKWGVRAVSRFEP